VFLASNSSVNEEVILVCTPTEFVRSFVVWMRSDSLGESPPKKTWVWFLLWSNFYGGVEAVLENIWIEHLQ
jgi:hypothetical protein